MQLRAETTPDTVGDLKFRGGAPDGMKTRRHLPRDIGEPEVPPLETVDQPFVIQPEQVQDRGVQIVDVDRVLHHSPSEVVRLPNDRPPFHAATGQPQGEGQRMMIATGDLGIARAILARSPQLRPG